ncbi:DUF481 domain-containing protein [Shewanella sp.]|uniref:DUF481 domain-containing protein n=1 Tax=Shewanella sp. TaxID=50422 RepID=UPI003F3A4678
MRLFCNYFLPSKKLTALTLLPLAYNAQLLANDTPPAASTFVPVKITAPVGDKFDWLQLTSLEILKGDIKTLYDDKLEFDSDELGVLVIDWDDVKILQSKGIVSVGFTDLTTKTGRLQVQNGKSYLDGVEFDPQHIMTLIAGEPTEANYWSSKISLGANFRQGNTDQIDYSAQAKVTRRTTESRFNAGYLGNYTKADGENTVNNHRINGHFDWFLSKQFYLRPVFAEYYKDPFLNIGSKITLGSGVGYNLIDTSKTELSISAGPAYTYTRFDQHEVGSSNTEGSGTFVLDTAFDTELSKSVDFNAQYRIQYGNQQSGGYSHHAMATFEVELTDMFDLDLSFVWDRTNNPRANADGTVPNANDYQFIVGFSIDM